MKPSNRKDNRLLSEAYNMISERDWGRDYDEYFAHKRQEENRRDFEQACLANNELAIQKGMPPVDCRMQDRFGLGKDTAGGAEGSSVVQSGSGDVKAGGVASGQKQWGVKLEEDSEDEEPSHETKVMRGTDAIDTTDRSDEELDDEDLLAGSTEIFTHIKKLIKETDPERSDEQLITLDAIVDILGVEIGSDHPRYEETGRLHPEDLQ